MRPRYMWADYPSAQDWAPSPPDPRPGDIRTSGYVNDQPEPIATIVLPGGRSRDVFPPARPRIGFRSGRT